MVDLGMILGVDGKGGRVVAGLASRRNRPMTAESVEQAIKALDPVREPFLYASFIYEGKSVWVEVNKMNPQTLDQLAQEAARKYGSDVHARYLAFQQFYATDYNVAA